MILKWQSAVFWVRLPLKHGCAQDLRGAVPYIDRRDGNIVPSFPFRYLVLCFPRTNNYHSIIIRELVCV